MDPHSSGSTADQGSTPQFNIESFSGYGSTVSSLPGSGAVTPRTTVFADAHPDERAALLPGVHGDPAEAEAGGSGSKGEPFKFKMFSVPECSSAPALCLRGSCLWQTQGVVCAIAFAERSINPSKHVVCAAQWSTTIQRRAPILWYASQIVWVFSPYSFLVYRPHSPATVILWES